MTEINRDMRPLRQGDVLLHPVQSIPRDATDITPTDRIVLAHGAVTGHAHAIALGGVALLERSGSRFIRVDVPTHLRHEEHSEIPLAKGGYQVITQVEYTPEALRNVAD